MLEYAAGAGLAMVIYHRLQSADAMSTATGCGLLGLGVASLAAIDTLLYNRLYGDNVERAWLRCAGLGHWRGALVLERAGGASRSRTLMAPGSAECAICLFHLSALRFIWKSRSASLKFDRKAAAMVAAVAGLLASAAMRVVVHVLLDEPLQALFKAGLRGWLGSCCVRQPAGYIPGE